MPMGEFRLWRIFARQPLTSELDALCAANANSSPIRQKYKRTLFQDAFFFCNIASVLIGEEVRDPRVTIERSTPKGASFYGEANASISELFSIASNSSLVGTVTGSFLKLKVITSLSLDNNDLFCQNTSILARCARPGTSQSNIALKLKKSRSLTTMKSLSR